MGSEDLMGPDGVLIRPMQARDLDAADTVMRTAFGTHLGVPNPLQTFGDAQYVRPRFAASPDSAFTAEREGEVALGRWPNVAVAPGLPAAGTHDLRRRGLRQPAGRVARGRRRAHGRPARRVRRRCLGLGGRARVADPRRLRGRAGRTGYDCRSGQPAGAAPRRHPRLGWHHHVVRGGRDRMTSRGWVPRARR